MRTRGKGAQEIQKFCGYHIWKLPCIKFSSCTELVISRNIFTLSYEDIERLFHPTLRDYG